MFTHPPVCLLITSQFPRVPDKDLFHCAVCLFLLGCHFPAGQAVTCVLFASWFPGTCQSLTSFPTGLVEALPWLTCFFNFNRFIAHGLLIALMMEAVWFSKMLVNLYQSTRYYNPEDSHLNKHCQFSKRKDSGKNLWSFLTFKCLHFCRQA
jgi:hypothetical protein